MPRARSNSTAPTPSASSPDTVFEGAIRGMVGYNLKRAYIVLHAAARAAAEDFGLRVPTFSCLSVIVRNPGITPSALAEHLKIERPNLVVIVDELETRELIRRTQMKTDRRRYELTVTVRGRRLHDQAAEAIRDAEAQCLQGLGAEDQARLIDLLNKIENAMTEAPVSAAEHTGPPPP
ncbi:MarR family transcriptional regulator [Roseospira marina]|uniref:MarR family transcriptional regulator n=1 Tax=Roseospira marina TaxID=140057 RepID=A0A5M6IEB7_9PROT|nr:MarR family transcriptional regulator [Roseospira marina]KAA5606620.1 MarR family transcriptional regulator [Roseospira marina]MBB4313977.1 DNA-binding MarR family transcriptional regulator [Roseospira marina]MBB5087139.1 DNA-binding MarR family transcriptional regulator [Roseospira marina]